VSPRLLEAALLAFSRWLDTYTVPEEKLPAPCEPLAQDPAAVLRVAVEASAACLTGFPHEPALHSVAVQSLLLSLVNRPRRCAAVSQLPIWAEFCDAVCTQGPGGPFNNVNSKLQRRLVATVCSAIARWQPSLRTAKGEVIGRAAEAERLSESLLRRLLAPSLQLLAQFAQTGGSARAEAVSQVAGKATVVCSEHPKSVDGTVCMRC
jgi:hypothetical protein